MIYHDNPQVEESDFLDLLEKSKQSIITRLRYNPVESSKLSGDAFELLTYEEMCKNAISTPFEGRLIHTADREFPDIVAAGYYGIEVKATKKDGWTSIGNSVLESSRISTVKRIYILFGKLGGTPDVMCRRYEDCLRGIAVTHYPRYQIDMNLADGNSIFDLMNVSYDTMRNDDNPVKYVRNYYKTQMSEGDALWWIDDGDDSVPELSPVIKNYSSLDTEVRDGIKADLFILYPEILSNSSNKYKNVPAHLASRYGVVCPNVRDIFTAGGRVPMKDADGNEFTVPQVVGELIRLAPLIERKLQSQSMEELTNSWGHYVNETLDAEQAWMYEINRHAVSLELEVKLSSLYKDSLAKISR